MFILLILNLFFSIFLFNQKQQNIFLLTSNYKNFLISYKPIFDFQKKKFQIIKSIEIQFKNCKKYKNVKFCCRNISDSNHISTLYDDIENYCRIKIKDINEKFILR